MPLMLLQPPSVLAARVAQRATVQAGVGLGLVEPVGARIADAVQIAHRDVDPVVVVLAPASISSTRLLASAERRLASRQPAVPAPTMM
jgi:hypothetical protein